MNQLSLQLSGDSKRYTKSVIIKNDSSLDIAEAFGIESDYERKLYDVTVPNFKILMITGESGSGKTTLAKDIVKDYKHTTPPPFNKDIPVYQNFKGESIESQLKMLTRVGLGDAVLFLTPYKFLSDSQQARFRIAWAVYSNPDDEVVFIDEFLSTLDRKTAQAVAYSLSKLFLTQEKKVILTTAQNDLNDYARADVVLQGSAFPSEFKAYKPQETALFEGLRFEYADKDFYRELRLAELHYKGKYTGGAKEYLIAWLDDEVVGVLLSTNHMWDDGRRISRLVVHPSYRGCGFGKKLVQRYLKDYPDTDVVASMSKFNPVFERAGMQEVAPSIIKSPPKMKSTLKKLGFDATKWHSREYCNAFCRDKNNRKELSVFSKHATKLVQPGGKKLTVDEISDVMIKDQQTCGRVLYQLRDREMGKFVHGRYKKEM